MKKVILFFILSFSCLFADNIFKLNGTSFINKQYKLNFFNIKNSGIPTVSIDFNNTQKKLKVVENKDSLIYILVDSSIPMKHAYNKGIKPFLEKKFIPFLKKQGNRIMVSHFDSNLIKVYDSKKDHSISLNKIKILGKTTELWRNTLNALKEISNISTSNKIMVVLSDGDAEDTPAYSIKDVIQFAKKHKIRIVSIAYLNKITTQNMRKVADETFGKVFIANKNHKLKYSLFQNDFNQILKSNFDIIIPNKYIKPNISGKKTIKLSFNLGNYKEIENIDLKVPKPPKNNKNFIEKYKYNVIFSLIILTLAILYLLFRKPKVDKIDDNEDSTIIITPKPSPLALLASMGGTVHYIYKFPSTIGKSKKNDVVISGDYISRNHAVINFKDGYYYLTDSGSANGTKVNGEEIGGKGSKKIKPNDIIEFGPYKTVFKLN